MQMQELLATAREAFGARREYGEPYEHDGVTVITASSVRGGGGGGGDDKENGGGGGGFGMAAKPAGAWVIKGDQVTWKPAVDPTRILVGLELLAGLALLERRRVRRLRRIALAAMLLRRAGLRRTRRQRMAQVMQQRVLHRAPQSRVHVPFR